MIIEFFVPGVPKPAGSKRGFYNKKLGRVMIVDASGQKGADWRGDVKAVASAAYQGPLMEGALCLQVRFFMPRPKDHFRTGKYAHVLRIDAPTMHTVAPDATKLLRGLEDALTGILWADDSRIAHQEVYKFYCGPTERPGAEVVVLQLEGPR